MGVRVRLGCLAVGLALGLTAATQVVAARYQYQPALGWGLLIGETAKLYPPWDILIWAKRWAQSEVHGPVIRAGAAMIMFGLAAGAMAIRLFDQPGTRPGTGELQMRGHASRVRGWGDVSALRKAGLVGDQGVIFGRVDREKKIDRWRHYTPDLLVSPDHRPLVVTGGTRSGKGRGIVVPSLLNWNWSALVFDPKEELWGLTSGFRRSLGPALFFNPQSPVSARFNPLAEITTGPDCVDQVRRLVAILVEPGGGAGVADIWDRLAGELLEALILHVLHTAEPDAKNLLTVKDLSADLDAATHVMKATYHIETNGKPACHPHISQIARAYAGTHEKGRKSVAMTLRSHLAWIGGASVERAISTSDFRIGDLMCAQSPVSLYVQVSPADLKALQPLVRLFFHLAATAFTTHVTTDSDGRLKENALLMALDEFPLLGKVSFFEDVVRLAAGYGVKCLFVAQSLNDIVRVYGPNNGFIDNAHVYVAFAALDPLTREKVSKLTGMVSEQRESASLPHHFMERGGMRTIAEVERPLLDMSEVGALPDDRQLIFIAGHRPYLLPKLRYDKVGWMAERAAMPAHDQSKALDTPEFPGHPWAEHRGFGVDPDARIEFGSDNGGQKNFGPATAMTPANAPAPAAPPTVSAEQSTQAPELAIAPMPVSTVPALANVRASWDTGRPLRRKANPAQASLDFDPPAQADAPPANDAKAAKTPEFDLLDRLHGGSL